MLRIVCVLAAVTGLAACRPKPAAAIAELSGPNSLSGVVGQLDDADRFLTFIESHHNQTVSLDLQFSKDDFDVDEDSDSASFVVWEECENLPEGGKPSTVGGGCTGFQFTLPDPPGKQRALIKDGGVWRVRGQFRVEPAGGPLQGLMIIRLTPRAQSSGGTRP